MAEGRTGQRHGGQTGAGTDDPDPHQDEGAEDGAQHDAGQGGGIGDPGLEEGPRQERGDHEVGGQPDQEHAERAHGAAGRRLDDMLGHTRSSLSARSLHPVTLDYMLPDKQHVFTVDPVRVIGNTPITPVPPRRPHIRRPGSPRPKDRP
ncbi:hypothetical protein MICRO116_50051 [Micrococcus sp. 116]|nr:hypothetical protein MICRO116_50051 [Micrococcus sp. 116]